VKLVIDTNRLIAGLLRDSANRRIIQANDFDLIAPDYLLIEINKHEKNLLKKSKLPPDSYNVIL